MSVGLKIKIKLMERGLTQRWLHEQLRKNGFGTLTEANLSLILNGKYTFGCAESVIETSKRILEETNKGVK